MGKGLNLAKLAAMGLAVWATLVVAALSQDSDPRVPNADPRRTQSNVIPRPSPATSLRETGAPPPAESFPPNDLRPVVGADAFNPSPIDATAGQSPGPDDLFIPPPKTYYFRVEGGAMLRAANRSTVMQEVESTTGAMSGTLFTGDIDYQFTGAGNFLLGIALTDCIQFESLYTGVLQQTNTADVWDDTPNKFFQDPAKLYPVPGNMFSPFSNFGGGIGNGIQGLDYNKYARISCTSQFNNVELNLRRRVPLPPELMAMSLLVGVRYTGLPDKFGYFTMSDVDAAGQYVKNGSVNEINISTTNEMIGPQVGALVEFYTENHWWLTCETKIALMNNRCSETSYYRNVNDGLARAYSSTVSGNQTTTIADVNFTCVYRWSPHFTTRLGYRALWLSGIAQAQDNFSTNINVYQYDQTAQLNSKASAVYHGPFVGLDFSW
jgi:hypothetical protein